MRFEGLKRAVLVLAILGAIFLVTSFIAFRVGFLFVVLALLCFCAAVVCALYLPWGGRRARAAKWLRRVIYAGLAVGLCSFIWVQGFIVSGWPGDNEVEADCLIVLGAGLRGEVMGDVLLARAQLAAQYLLEHPGCIAVVTGGQGPGESITEALAMARYLESRGIGSERIFMETEATSTIENLRFSREILAREGLLQSRIAVVSSAFHIYRARWMAEYIGLPVEALGAPTPHFPLTPLNSYVREYFSIVLMYAKAWMGRL